MTILSIDEGLSVQLMRAMGDKLVSKDVAVKFAELLLLDRHGQVELDRQSPLQIAPEGDRWIVTGSCEPQIQDNRNAGMLGHGRVKIIISQFDGRVLDFTFTGAFPLLSTKAAEGPR